MNSSWLNMTTFLLVVVGALNWGLVGLFNLNLVSLLFGGMPFLVTLVYVLVGLSCVYVLVMYKDGMVTKGKKK